MREGGASALGRAQAWFRGLCRAATRVWKGEAVIVRVRFRPPRPALLIVSAVAVLMAGAWWAWRLSHPVYDLVIYNGRVFDGEEFVSRGLRVGVRDGRISRVGWLRGVRSRDWLDARGGVVAPGFIDVHAHVERNIPKGREFLAANFVQQGVATLITGNCGTSTLDLRGMMEGLRRSGSQVNVASLVGHNSIRSHIVKRPAAAATGEEIRRMAALVESSMAEGALGLSTGLAYAPGCFARPEEVIALAKVARRRDGLYVTHVRDEGVDGESSLEEALAVREAAAVPLHISHIKIAARKQWGRAAARLERLNEARRRGPPITFDVYAYPASSTSTEILAPLEYRGSHVNWRRLSQDDGERRRLYRGMLVQLAEAGFPDYSHVRIANFWSNHKLDGSFIPQAAKSLGFLRQGVEKKSAASGGKAMKAGRTRPDSDDPLLDPRRPQLDAIVHLMARGGAQMIYFDMSDEDVTAFLRDSHATIGTDSAVRYPDQTAAHPRGVGNFAKILGEYVREKRVLTLDDALRKMTSSPARIFGLEDRGFVRSGYAADITIFDPDTIGARNSYDKPLTPPAGISHLFVNGIPVLRDGEVLPAHAGQPLQRARRR
jgi:N-acyl-D-amino-acid deacylase